MRRILQLLIFVALGLGLAWFVNVDAAALPASVPYRLGAYLLLAIGLYGATYGIDLTHAANDKKIIISAVTIGVIVKAILIGGVLALAWHDPLFLLLGVAVAQIDPLSVAALMGGRRMSTRARTVLAAWSSFDDPVTVILAFYAATAAVAFGLGATASTGEPSTVLTYVFQFGGNVLLAAGAWVIWWVTKRIPLSLRTAMQYLSLAAFIAAAVITGWMLAIAIIGLFARPSTLENLIPKITNWAMYAAAVALGVLLIGGVSLIKGTTLGIAAFIAQALVAWPLTRGMPRPDRLHLAAAQQHGITAIILGLTLEIQFDGVVAVIAPTIITANLIHLAVNKLIDRKLGEHQPPSIDAPKSDDGPIGQPNGSAPVPRSEAEPESVT